jgi:hypothetical protein
MHRRRHDRSGSDGHALAVMANVGHVNQRPGTADLQRRGGRVPRSDIVMRALVTGCTLAHGARALWEKASGGCHVSSARHHRDTEAKQRAQCIDIDIRLAKAERQGVARSGIA